MDELSQAWSMSPRFLHAETDRHVTWARWGVILIVLVAGIAHLVARYLPAAP